MAWTSVKTWVANEVVDENDFNQQIRDQFTVLSTHQHTGAAGQGNDELSGLDILDFDDQAASPAQAGRLMRNGNNLEWYGAAMVAITEADAIASTASPRTLGAGAQQGAPGDHGHSSTNLALTNEVSTVAADNDGGSTVGEEVGQYTLTDTQEIDVHQETTSQKVGAIAFGGHFPNPGSGVTLKMSIEADGVEIDSQTLVGATGGLLNVTLLGLVVKNTANIAFKTQLNRSGTAGTSYMEVRSLSSIGTGAGGQVSNPTARLARADLGAV